MRTFTLLAALTLPVIWCAPLFGQQLISNAADLQVSDTRAPEIHIPSEETATPSITVQPSEELALQPAPLPEAPGPAAAGITAGLQSPPLKPCYSRTAGHSDESTAPSSPSFPCLKPQNPYSPFLNNGPAPPLSPRQKAHLAVRGLFLPGNLATIAGNSAYTIGTNSHTAYGPGWAGFGRNVGYTFVQDATGDFFGAFFVPTLTHEDPRYARMPHASIPRRFVHAVSRTIIARSDSGSPIPNYATLLTNPICNEISNLYVPGIHGNGPSTVARIMTGYATDPVNNLITEFLPDVARHVHVQIIFVQQIINQISQDQYTLP